MSNLNGKAAQRFQARFGEAPGCQGTEHQRWALMCQELLEELAKVRGECEDYRRMAQKLLPPTELDLEMANLTFGQFQALAVKGQSFQELIQEVFPD